eukprot:49022_1
MSSSHDEYDLALITDQQLKEKGRKFYDKLWVRAHYDGNPVDMGKYGTGKRPVMNLHCELQVQEAQEEAAIFAKSKRYRESDTDAPIELPLKKMVVAIIPVVNFKDKKG